jgi:muconate cycloisomerase
VKPVEVSAFHVRLPFRKAVRHASHSRASTENVVVRCVLADGTEGYGEGVPREYVTGETIEHAIELLHHSDLSSQFEPCATFAEAAALAERIQLAPVPGDERGCQGNAARCALEMALLDAYGRHFGEPLSAVTRLLAPDLYQPRSHVRYSGAIMSTRAGFKLRLTALRLWMYWFKQVKVKVGIEGQDDVRRLSDIRRRLGRWADLRVDANEAWSPAEVVERIRELERFNLSSIEQPVPHADVAVLAEIRRQTHTPIMLDESLCSRFDAERAVKQGMCDLFNLRLSKCGGFIPSLRLAQFARQHGLGYQLGCQIGETALLSAAGRHFASSVAGLRAVEGSFDRHLMREPLGTTDLTFGWGGWAPALPGTGLGVTIDRQALARVTIRTEVLCGRDRSTVHG